MNTDLVQTLTLVIAANARIGGRPTPRYAVGEGHFQFWESYEFVKAAKGLFGAKTRVLADSPQAWLDDVAESARAVRAFPVAQNNPLISDREASGFAGGGAQWIIEVEKAQGCDLWRPSMALGDRDRADRRIWRSQVWRIARGEPRQPRSYPTLQAAEAELSAALEGVLAFAVDHALDNFADVFRDGLAMLDRRRVRPRYELFDGLTLPDDAGRLLAAAGVSHVFGGMGSWNDMGFQGEEDAHYQRVSDRLYQAIQAALPAAANSTAEAA